MFVQRGYIFKRLNAKYLCRSFCLAVSKSNPKENKKIQSKENQSFMANIFRGSLVPSEVFPYPDVLTSDQKELTASLIDPFEKFFVNVNNAALNDANSKIDENTLEKLWELGAFGIQVPNDFGGLGLNNTQYGRLCEIVGKNDLALGITIGAHQSIGFKGILLFGTPEQKEKYLPKVSSEKIYAAFALTEPSSGSDANSIKCRAVKSEDGKHFILNGSKIWISNGGLAEIFTVFAQSEHIDSETGLKKDKITAFIVERSFGGVTNGPAEKKMGIKASNTTEVYFENVKVPISNVLGKEGEGFKVAMNILNNGRFGMGATLAGTMKYCIQKATEHANTRVQFGKKLKEYESIQEKIAQMSIVQYATESMAYNISQNMDSGSQDYHLEAAISKIYASESAWYVCDEAIQILGGMGFMKDAGLERVLRDLRIFRIFEGTNDILRLFIALTGIQYAGLHLKRLQNALKSPSENLELIFREATKRAAKTVGIEQINLTPFVAPELMPYAKKTALCIEVFGQKVEQILVKYGKNVIHEQIILNKLANCAIDIYAMIVTLSRATRAVNLNLTTSEHELNLAKALTMQASERVLENLRKTTCKDKQELSLKMKMIAGNVSDNDGVNTTNVIDMS